MEIKETQNHGDQDRAGRRIAYVVGGGSREA